MNTYKTWGEKGDVSKYDNRIEQPQKQVPGQERFGSDEGIPGRDDFCGVVCTGGNP